MSDYPFFAVIVCRKFASVTALSWHFRTRFPHHKNAAAMNCGTSPAGNRKIRLRPARTEAAVVAGVHIFPDVKPFIY
jgi:hypothetical protein